MARAHEVLRWLLDAGCIEKMPTLHLLRGFWGNETLHADTCCSSARGDLTALEPRLTDLDAGTAELCLRCIPFTIRPDDREYGQHVFAAMSAMRLIAAAEDISHVPHADILPAIRAERVHQVLDYLTGTAARGAFGSTATTLIDGIAATIRTTAERHPRHCPEAVMVEATRFAAIMNARRGRETDREVLRALIAGQEPSEVLALTPVPQRPAVGLLIEEIERRIVETRPQFVIIGCYPSTMYDPARSLLEVAVIASARYTGQHRVIGELPSEICAAYPDRPHKDNRNPHPYLIDIEWVPVTDEVIETALILWRQSSADDPWQHLPAAFETAIALG